MSLDKLIRCARHVQMFHGLAPLQISEIVRRAERAVYKTGAVIVEENRKGDAAILIVSGTAARVSGPDLITPIEQVSEGSLIAEMAMFIEIEHLSTIVAQGPVKALRFSRAELHDVMLEDPDIADHFVQYIARGLNSIAEQMRDIDRQLARVDAKSVPGARDLHRPAIAPSAVH